MIGLALGAAVTHGVFLTGNDLYARCQQSDQTICVAYIIGISDAMNGLENAETIRPKLCTTATVTPAQERDVVVTYLQRHPETRHQEAGGLVLAALIEAFPCRD